MMLSSPIKYKLLRFTSPALLFTLWVLIFPTFLFAQGSRDQNSDIQKLPLKKAELLHTVNFHEMKATWNPFMKNTKVIHEPGVDKNKDLFHQRKAEANRRRAEQPSNRGTAVPSQKTSADLPARRTHFLGQWYDRIPNDNSLAVSNDGKIVSVTNSRIHIFDENGTVLDTNSLDAFVTGTGAGTAVKFDPVTVYDPVSDRFIVVFLNGTASGNSKVIVCFSTTNDPTGNWNVYVLDGEVVPGNWTDYPQIGISTDELFITGNVFQDNQGGGTGSIIWQINKADGYAGNPLTIQPWMSNEFSFRPVTGGVTMYGPHFYFIRTVSFGPASTVYIHEIDNTIANGGTLSNGISLNSSIPYLIPPDVDQPDTDRNLITSDNRVRDAYFENNRIEFVLNTAVNNRPAVYHGTVQLATPIAFSSVTARVISDPVKEMAYPSLAYGGLMGLSGENASLIMAIFASNVDYPGNGCWFVDTDGTVSDFFVCKSGIRELGGGAIPWRWGDYTAFAERYNNPGEAWMAGSYGSTGKASPTYISQIFSPGTVSKEPISEPLQPTLTSFPNPAQDQIKFEFEVPEYGMYRVSVMDIQGRELDLLLEDALKAGEALLTFDTAHLKNGLYFVVVEKGNIKIFQDKFMVKR